MTVGVTGWAAIEDAIELIKAGKCTRVDVSDMIKVYKCKNIIRIDIKVHG